VLLVNKAAPQSDVISVIYNVNSGLG